MKTKPYLILAFVLLVVAQWYIPYSMIAGQENVLKNGKEYKFLTRPIDPTDPFRGKYVTLNFVNDYKEFNDTTLWNRHDPVYVLLKENNFGFAEIDALLHEAPSSGDYIETRIARVSRYETPYRVEVFYPFNKFFMEEKKAPEAERTYNDSNSKDDQTVYALVNVKDGKTALKDLVIEGKSIYQILDERKNELE